MNPLVGWAILAGVVSGILLCRREKNPEKENFEQARQWLQQVSDEGKGRSDTNSLTSQVSQRTENIVFPE